jgi:hypothetical protein
MTFVLHRPFFDSPAPSFVSDLTAQVRSISKHLPCLSVVERALDVIVPFEFCTRASLGDFHCPVPQARSLFEIGAASGPADAATA